MARRDNLPPLPPPEAAAAEVHACIADPDFTTYPGASIADIKAAEAALGCEFPPHHRAMLQTSNGLSALRGYTNYFGVGDNAVVDIVAFNDRNGWLAKLPDDWLPPVDAVWIAAREGCTLIGMDRETGETLTTSPLVRHDLRTWGREGVGRMLTIGLQSMRKRGLAAKPEWRRVLKKVGDVALDEGLIWGPRYYLESEQDLVGLRKTSLTLALQVAADLSADLERIGTEEAHYYAQLVPYIDDDGVARAKWAIRQEFPDGPPTVVTIDGQMP